MQHQFVKDQQLTLWHKVRDNIFWVWFVGYITVVTGVLVTLILPTKSRNPFWTTFDLYTGFWGIWLVMMLIITLFKNNRYILKFIGKNGTGNTLAKFGKGILIGFALNAGLILLAYLHGDFQLTFAAFQPFSFLLMFFAVLIQSSSEELICRVFIYQRLRRGYKSPWVAILGNALFFAILHLGNDGMAPLAFYNLFIVGLFFSLIVYYFDSFWMVSAIHTMWNFTQNIIFGLPNSGTLVKYSVFKLENGLGMNSLFYDRNFGIEGTIADALVFTSGCILLYMINEKGRQKLDELCDE